MSKRMEHLLAEFFARHCSYPDNQDCYDCSNELSAIENAGLSCKQSHSRELQRLSKYVAFECHTALTEKYQLFLKGGDRRSPNERGENRLHLPNIG
jgi:hypothetical protein